MDIDLFCPSDAWTRFAATYQDRGISLSRVALAEASDRQRLVITQTAEHGVAVFLDDDQGGILLAAPLLCNERLLGGLVGRIEEQALFDGATSLADCQALASTLIAETCAAGWSNAALLRERRLHYEHERERAAGIHAGKQQAPRSLMCTYLDREQALITAVRGGDAEGACALVNEILVAFYHHGAGDLDLLKGLLLELVVLLGRSAVDAGVPSRRVIDHRLHALIQLTTIDDDEMLSAWLVSFLEQILGLIAECDQREQRELIQMAVQVLDERMEDPDLDRETVAAELHLTGAQLSALLKSERERGFSDWLARHRIERACRLMDDPELSLLQIALTVGFRDPSYFTKVFRRITGSTPRAWRKPPSGPPAS